MYLVSREGILNEPQRRRERRGKRNREFLLTRLYYLLLSPILAAIRDFIVSIASGVGLVVCHAGRDIKRLHQVFSFG